MKKNLIPFIALLFLGCDAPTQKSPVKADSVSTDSVTKAVRIDSAKRLLDSANFYMAKGIKKEMDKTEVRKHVSAIMENFQSIYKKLAPTDTLEVYQYRVDRVNEMIDLQMAHPDN